MPTIQCEKTMGENTHLLRWEPLDVITPSMYAQLGPAGSVTPITVHAIGSTACGSIDTSEVTVYFVKQSRVDYFAIFIHNVNYNNETYVVVAGVGTDGDYISLPDSMMLTITIDKTSFGEFVKSNGERGTTLQVPYEELQRGIIFRANGAKPVSKKKLHVKVTRNSNPAHTGETEFHILPPVDHFEVWAEPNELYAGESGVIKIQAKYANNENAEFSGVVILSAAPVNYGELFNDGIIGRAQENLKLETAKNG